MPKWAFLIFPAFGLLFLVGALAIYRSASARVDAVAKWPTTEGTVIATDLERSESSSKDSKGRRTTTVTYEPIVFFRYAAGGKSFRSKSLWLNEAETFSNGAEGDVFLMDYRVGTKLRVRYDPANPSDAAVILNGPSVGIWIMAAMGLICLGAGYLVWRVFGRDSVPQVPEARGS